MRVLYDDIGFRQRLGGVSRYFVEIIKHLPEEISPVLAIRRTKNIFLQDSPFGIESERFQFDYVWFKDQFLGGINVKGLGRIYEMFRFFFPDVFHNEGEINQNYFRHQARQENIDLIHFTSPHQFNYNWRNAAAGKPFVVTVHDLTPETLLGDVKVMPFRKKILVAANAIIAVSKWTKEQIVRVYNISPEKISVIYHGCSLRGEKKVTSCLAKQKYVLFVGGRWTYKNFHFFVHAIAPVLLDHKDLHLVCTGKPFSQEEIKLLDKVGIKSRTIQFSPSESELFSVYSNAECFVYPSKMEGFGIPILEAFSSDCPVLLSRCSCFPEVAEDAALYFEDGNAVDFRQKLENILIDSSVRQKLKEKGRARVRLFSWEKAALETAEVYKAVGCSGR